MADASKSNPNDLNGPNEYAGFVAPERADASTVTYYGSNPMGNRVNDARIPKTMDTLDKTQTKSSPLGTSHGSGY